MRFFIFLIFLVSAFASAFANAFFEAKDSYEINTESIYSTDMFSNAPRFKIASFPYNALSISLDSKVLQELFAKHNLTLHTKQETINFIYNSTHLDNAKNAIIKAYKDYYGNLLEIKKIYAKSLNNLKEPYEIVESSLNPAMLKKNSGILSLKYKNAESSAIKQASIIYEIDGIVEILKAIENIAVGENLSTSNVKSEKIKFVNIKGILLDKAELDSHSAKSFIKKDSIIFKDKTKPKILVKKGENVLTKGSNDGIEFEFILQAMQSGALNEIINAKNLSSGKIIRVKITAKGKAQIL